MKQILFYLSLIALVLTCALTASCSEITDDSDLNGTVTLTTTVTMSQTTKALSEGGVKSFAKGDQIAVVYTNKSGNKVRAVSVALDDKDISGTDSHLNKIATFSVTLTDPDRTKNATIIYPAAMAKDDGSVNYDALYSSQDGTLAKIASSFDYCTYTGAWNGSNLPTNVTLENQLALVKFTLKNKADASALSVNKLFVTAGGTTCEVTPGGATSELYVAVPAIASGRVTLTALSGSTYYDYLKTGVTLAQSQYYTISASLTEVKSISNAREASLGRVVAADRMMYASVESATNAGTTALAVIARMHAGIVHNDFTAIAVSDESSRLNWNNANNACNNKTPIGGATWQLPSVSLWEDMFWFNGGNEYNCTGLNTLITKAGGTALRTDGNGNYWTNTDDQDNDGYKCVIGIGGTGAAYEDSFTKDWERDVRAFLTFQGDYSIL
ncbi:MAG: hypothetical protein IKS47_04965 [Bacteroidales bacterium]|nr:hypothetical protein [Bacteroidales bacterium]